jgi:hypothetical protein
MGPFDQAEVFDRRPDDAAEQFAVTFAVSDNR